MKIILQPAEIEREMLGLLSRILVMFEGLTIDLEHEFGDDVLIRKIGEGFLDGRMKYSLRDRFGLILTDLLNTSMELAQNVGIRDREFRQAIDEVIGESRVYDGQYDVWSGLSPSLESMEVDRGHKRWWKPKN